MTSRFVLPLADVGAGLTPSAGAQLFFYETGTTTPKDTYSDAAGTTPNANPVVANSVGVFDDIFISGTYKVVLKNAAGVQQWAADPVESFLRDSQLNDQYVLDRATLAAATVDTTIKAGDEVNLAERTTGNGGGGMWDVIVGTGTANTYNIVAHDTLSLSFVLREESGYDVRQLGAVDDGVTNSGTALYYACLTGKTVVIPKDSGAFVFDLLEAEVDTVLDHLKYIRAEQLITIQLPEMDVTRGTIEVGSEYASNIIVRGGTVSQQSVTSIAIDSQAAGDHRVTFNVADSSAYAVNGFVFIKSISGSAEAPMLAGVWPVTAVAPGTVQCKITSFKATLPALTVSSGIISDVKTVIRVSGAVGIDSLRGGNCGQWRSMVLVGDGTGGTEAHGVRVLGGKISLAASTAEPFGVYGFAGHGVYGLENSTIQNYDSYISGNTRNGFYLLDGSNGQSTRLISTGNGLVGVAVSVNSSIAASQSILSGNGQRGILGSGSSHVIANTAKIYENGDAGVRSDNGAYVDIDSSFVAGSVSYGIRANDATIVGTVDFTGGNGASDEFTENNGKIEDRSKRLYKIGAGSGATAITNANGFVTDADTANGISILTPESSYGYLWFGNDADNNEAGFQYRGTSNSLDFISNGAVRMSINSSDNLTPDVDNDMDLGSASKRFRVVYAGTGTINTSDIRMKTSLLELEKKEKDCAKSLKAIIGKFKFLDSVERKGKDARIHFGVGAQTVKAVFESHGLEPEKYGLFCYDEWPETTEVVPAITDKDGLGRTIIIREEAIKHTPAGSRYGIRYDELLCFIIAGI